VSKIIKDSSEIPFIHEF